MIGTPSARSPRGARRPLRAVSVAVAATALAGCGDRLNTFVAPPPPKVTVAQPVHRDVTRYLEYSGTTESHQSVDLRARVSGFLEQVSFQPGGRVQKDQVLFVIDKRPYQAVVGRVRARIESLEAAYQGAIADARIAEELAAQRAGSELDKITKIAARDSAKAAVTAAEAELVGAQLDLDFCEVRAPFDGRITRNLVDVGNLVGQGQPTLLATIVASKPIYVSVDVSESDLLAVRRERMAKRADIEPGQVAPGEWRPVELAIADQPEFTIRGRIDYVDPLLDARTSTIRVRSSFDNADELLLPGLFVRLRFPMETAAALLVPDLALLADQGGRYALVVDAQNVVQLRRVTIGPLDGGLRVVTTGLQPDDRVVVSGLQRARPGAVVTPQTADAAAPAPQAR